MLITLVKGLLVGLGASVPLGPIGVLCVQRTLGKGRKSGFVSGLGAAAADTLFAALAILVLAFVLTIFETYRIFFLIAGGIILIVIGVKIYATNPVHQIRQKNKRGNRLFSDFISVFILTISNPGAIFLILGLFAFVGLDTDRGSGYLSIALALCGVVIGASLWWFTLSSIISHYHRHFRIRHLWVINRVAGAVIALLGAFSLIQGVYEGVQFLLH